MVDFNWAVGRIYSDWRQRRPKQSRTTLPPSYTTSVLRLISVNACRYAAPDSIECAKWSQTNPYQSESTRDTKGPFRRTSEFVCKQCNHPVVTNEQLIGKLCLAEEKAKFSERTLRRYVNDGDPIPVDQFRRAVANGFAQGWLGLWQTIAIWEHINQLNATRKGLLAVFQRALERKAFLQRQEFDVSPQDIEQELAKQLRLLDHEETRTLDQRLKAGNLPPEVRQLMEEVLLTRCQEASSNRHNKKT